MRRQYRQFLIRCHGSTILMLLIFTGFISLLMVWAMNYTLMEKKMRRAREMRTNLDTFIVALRRELEDGYKCVKLIGGQTFPHISQIQAPAGGFPGNDNGETNIEIRNFSWEDRNGNTFSYPVIRGDDPSTPAINEGTIIGDNPVTPQRDDHNGVKITRISIRRGLINPASLPVLRPMGATNRERWGQDRWYRPIHHGTFSVLVPPFTNPTVLYNYGRLANIINQEAQLPPSQQITEISTFGMIFAAEIIIEATEPSINPADTARLNSLFYFPRAPNLPNNRIQLYVKAALARRVVRSSQAPPALAAAFLNEPIIIGCYGPNTDAQFCDQNGKNFNPLVITDPLNIVSPLPNFGRYYCHFDTTCEPIKILSPVTNTYKSIFTSAENNGCLFPILGALGPQRSPYVTQPLPLPGLSMCTFCNPNPADPAAYNTALPINTHLKPQAWPVPNPNYQAPNEFGIPSGYPFAHGYPYF